MKAEVQRILERAMTVADLIAELETMPADAPVLFVCDYGDYHHTQQALPVGSVEDGEEWHVKESAYSQSGLAVCEAEEWDGEGEEPEEEEPGADAVILRMGSR